LKPWDPIYLFFTADMTGKYGAISKLGSWDIVNGGSKPRGYQNLAVAGNICPQPENLVSQVKYCTPENIS